MTYNTTLHCEGCVNKVKSHLNQEPKIKNWSAIIEDEVLLNIEGDLSEKEVNQLLMREGYELKSDSFWMDIHRWKRASFNTLNCLIGCSIGDFGMIIFLQAYYPKTSLYTQMLLAIIAGLCTSIILETIILRLKENFSWSLALKTAFGMSFISMVAMEIAMNSTDFMITGGKAAFDEVTYWLALAPSLLAGFVVPLPYNYYKLKKFNLACH